MVLAFVGAELVLYMTQAKVGEAAAEQTGHVPPQYVVTSTPCCPRAVDVTRLLPLLSSFAGLQSAGGAT